MSVAQKPTCDFYPSELTCWPCLSHYSVARAVSSASLKLTEITRGKGKWRYISWSVCRSLVWSRDWSGRKSWTCCSSAPLLWHYKLQFFWVIWCLWVLLSVKSFNNIFGTNSNGYVVHPCCIIFSLLENGQCEFESQGVVTVYKYCMLCGVCVYFYDCYFIQNYSISSKLLRMKEEVKGIVWHFEKYSYLLSFRERYHTHICLFNAKLE